MWLLTSFSKLNYIQKEDEFTTNHMIYVCTLRHIHNEDNYVMLTADFVGVTWKPFGGLFPYSRWGLC